MLERARGISSRRRCQLTWTTLTAPRKAADMSAIPRGFLFMPAFPSEEKKKEKKNVGSSVSHSWSGKRWQIPLCASSQVWWPPGEIAFRHQVTASLKIQRLIHIVAWKWSEVIKFGSRRSLIGWTPSVLLFAEAQLIPWLNTLISCVVEIRHKADLFFAHGSFFFLSFGWCKNHGNYRPS